MKIAICDDEALYREEIIKLLNEYSAGNKNISFESFSHAEDLLEALTKQLFDVYILDIVMPEINGIALGEEIRKADTNGRIVYLTSSREFAIDSYKVKAFNYLLKPVEQQKLFTTLDEIANRIIADEKSIIVKTKAQSIKLNIDSVMYAELSRRVVAYHLVNGDVIESLQLRAPFSDAVAPLLGDKRFFLCGKSIAVNLKHITEISNNTVVFKDKYNLYLSTKLIREVRSVWYDYWFNKEAKI